MNKQNSKFLTAAKATRIISWVLLGLMVLGIIIVTGFVVFDQDAFIAYVNGKPEIDTTWVILCYAFVVCGVGLPALFTATLARTLRAASGRAIK